MTFVLQEATDKEKKNIRLGDVVWPLLLENVNAECSLDL